MNEHVIVSMTSYPKRITNIGKAIYLLLTKQTRKPDEIHLWLAEPEFPNKEKDLPDDVNEVLKIENVFLHWLPKNTYDHKRYEIFKICNKDDLIFIFDDDTYHESNLIETVLNVNSKYKNCVVCFNTSSLQVYNGIKALYRPGPIGGPYINKTRINADSMYPAYLMPKEIYSEEYQKIRDEVVPMLDECWIVPWFIWYNIPIYFLKFGWGKEIDPINVKMNDGFVKTSYAKESNGYSQRDNLLAAMLNRFPQIKEKYKRLFNYG